MARTHAAWRSLPQHGSRRPCRCGRPVAGTSGREHIGLPPTLRPPCTRLADADAIVARLGKTYAEHAVARGCVGAEAVAAVVGEKRSSCGLASRWAARLRTWSPLEPG